MLEMVERDEILFSHLVFSDEVTFYLCGTVNHHNVCIWETHHPHETVEQQKDSPKVNVFCAVAQDKIYGPFFVAGNTITGQNYLEMLQKLAIHFTTRRFK